MTKPSDYYYPDCTGNGTLCLKAEGGQQSRSGKQKPFNQAFSSWSGALSVFLSYSAREDA